jgi:nucleoside-diphosphate-sugar epimerase
MQILVTGACSGLGQAVLRAIVARDCLLGALGAPVRVERIIAVDRSQPARLFVEPRVEYVCGTFEHSRFLARVMGTATDSVFHLSCLGAAAGIGPQLEDLDQALMRSVDTTRSLIDACQFQSARPRLVLASAVAARPDGQAPPPTADGICNAICELFLIECARRGFVDLRGVRLPPIAEDRLAPGAPPPLAAATALARGIPIPPAIAPAIAPVEQPAISAAMAAQALIGAHEMARVIPGPAAFIDVPATG